MRRALAFVLVLSLACVVDARAAEPLSEAGLRQLLREAEADEPDDPCLPYSFQAFHVVHWGGLDELVFRCNVDMRVRALGPDHAQVGTALERLADTLRREHRNEDAAALLQRAVAIKERQLGREAGALRTTLEALGLTYRDMGRFADAEAPLRRALALQVRDQPKWPTSGATFVLATVVEGQGRHAEAQRLLERAIASWDQSPGPGGDLVFPLNALAGTLLAQRRLAEADGVLRRALAILDERDLPPEHWARDDSVKLLATLRAAQGRVADAEAAYRQLLAIREKGAALARQAEALESLALFLRSQARASEAWPLEVRALALRDRLHLEAARRYSPGLSTSSWDTFDGILQMVASFRGQDHPDVVPHLYVLGYAMQQDGRAGETELHYKHALAIRERTLGPESPQVAASLEVLAQLYHSQGRTEDARLLRSRANEIRSRTR